MERVRNERVVSSPPSVRTNATRGPVQCTGPREINCYVCREKRDYCVTVTLARMPIARCGVQKYSYVPGVTPANEIV